MLSFSPVIAIAINLLSIVFLLALLYVIGGMGDNLKKIRKLLEEEVKSRHAA